MPGPLENANIKKFYQQSAKPFNYVPNDLVDGAPVLPPSMSGLMRIDPNTGNIWISAGNTLVSDWRLITGGGGGGGAIAIQYNGNPISAAATVLNFVGGLTVSGDPLVTIDIPTGPVIFKNTSPGNIIKNTTLQEVTYSQLIPENTVTPGSIIRISYRVKKEATSNTGPAYIAINIGTSYQASSTVAFAEIDWSIVLPNAYGQLKREFVVDSVTADTKFIDNKVPIFDDNTQALSEESEFIDWSINQTIFFTIQHPLSVADSAAGSYYCIEIY